MSPLRAQLSGRPALVLGLGAFGGGAGCAAALARLGAQVTVTDLRPAEQLQEALAQLEGLGLETALGGHPEHLFQGQLVVVNPAVPVEAPVLELARSRGCRLTTQVNLALEQLAGSPALAITGTHGKSTCASLAAHLLEQAGLDAELAGNLGGSLLEAALDRPADRRWVLELSSFQLERLEAPAGWPRAAVLTSLGADHLDRHHSLERYWAAKRRLLEFQGEDGAVVLPLAEAAPARAGIQAWAEEARGRVLWTSAAPLESGREGWFPRQDRIVERLDGIETELGSLAAAPFREPYRLPSLLGAVAGARLLGLPAAEVEPGLRGWPGLPHRMQELPAPPGQRWIDNGVATHPEPTAAALAELPAGTILCAGGYDKGLDLEPLQAACARCAEVHLSGPGGARLAGLLAAAGQAQQLHPDAETAMKAALEAVSGSAGVLLYSPSFSSFDEYRNFRDRARRFQELCRDFAALQI